MGSATRDWPGWDHWESSMRLWARIGVLWETRGDEARRGEELRVLLRPDGCLG